MKIDGFKKIDYPSLQAEMRKVYRPEETPEIVLATQINVKSVQTVKNAFNEDEQVVSDEVLSNILKELGIISIIGWSNGERNYYIQNGKH